MTKAEIVAIMAKSAGGSKTSAERAMNAFVVFGVALVALGRPHRLEAQDTALSRLKHGFESRWGHHSNDQGFLRLRAHLSIENPNPKTP